MDICTSQILHHHSFRFKFVSLVGPDLFSCLRGPVHADHDSVVSFVGLEGNLLKGLHLFRPHLLHLAGEHGLGFSGGINAVGLEKKGKEN